MSVEAGTQSSIEAMERSIRERPIAESSGRIFFGYIIYLAILGLAFFIVASLGTGTVIGFPGIIIIYIIATIVGGAISFRGADALDKQRWRRFRNGGLFGLFLGTAIGFALFFWTYAVRTQGFSTELAPTPSSYTILYACVAVGSGITGSLWMLARNKRDRETVIARLRAQQAISPPTAIDKTPSAEDIASNSSATTSTSKELLAAHYKDQAFRLQVIDASTSELLHQPVYDCGMDEFHLPCGHYVFDSGDLLLNYGSLNRDWGWLNGEESISKWTSMLAHRSEVGPTTMIAAPDHLTFLWSKYPHSPNGGTAYRLVRTGPAQWYVCSWMTGARPSAAAIDPPFFVAEMSNEEWMQREQATRSAERLNKYWPEEAERCRHRQP